MRKGSAVNRCPYSTMYLIHATLSNVFQGDCQAAWDKHTNSRNRVARRLAYQIFTGNDPVVINRSAVPLFKVTIIWHLQHLHGKVQSWLSVVFVKWSIVRGRLETAKNRRTGKVARFVSAPPNKAIIVNDQQIISKLQSCCAFLYRRSLQHDCVLFDSH